MSQDKGKHWSVSGMTLNIEKWGEKKKKSNRIMKA